MNLQGMDVQEGSGKYILSDLDWSFQMHRHISKQDFTPNTFDVKFALTHVNLHVSPNDLQLVFRLLKNLSSNSVAASHLSRVELSTLSDEGDVFVEACDEEPWKSHYQWNLYGSCEGVGFFFQSASSEQTQDVFSLHIKMLDINHQSEESFVSSMFRIQGISVMDLTSETENREILNADILSEDTSHLATIQRKEFFSESSEKQDYDVLWKLDFQNLIVNWNDTT
eukprot:33667-Hanusia_phi.AAC.1